MKQVDKKHYQFERYAYLERWSDYYYQLRETLLFKPKSILEIGVGDGVFGSYIQKNTHCAYTSVDVAEDLHPDVVGDVTELPFGDSSFDVVVAFEVLEHIPFEKFSQALSEIARVSKKGAVISLPHFGPPVSFSLKLPFLPRLKLSFKIPFPRRHTFNGEHYWEIGKKDFSLYRIRSTMSDHFVIQKDFVPFESQYHHFFVLEKL